MFLYTLLVETIALVALIVLVVQWSVKYFFALQIFQYSGKVVKKKKMEKTGKCKAFCFSSKRKKHGGNNYLVLVDYYYRLATEGFYSCCY